MKTPKAESTWEIAPEGNHVATICQLIDKGTQPNSNPDWEPSRILRVGYNLVDEKTSKGNRNIVVFADYNFSDASKKLKAVAKAFANVDEKKFKDWDTANLMGKSGMVNVEHATSKTTHNEYAKVTAVSPLNKNIKPKKSTEAEVLFYLDGEIDREVFDKFHDKLKAEIASSDEYTTLDRKKPAKPAKKVAGKK